MMFDAASPFWQPGSGVAQAVATLKLVAILNIVASLLHMIADRLARYKTEQEIVLAPTEPAGLDVAADVRAIAEEGSVNDTSRH